MLKINVKKSKLTDLKAENARLWKVVRRNQKIIERLVRAISPKPSA